MDLIRESFQKVKEDISLLKEEINFLKKSLIEDREKMIEIFDFLEKTKREIRNLSNKQLKLASTDKQTITTNKDISSTDNSLLEALKDQNKGFSKGNEGVSTDRQTDRQTDRRTFKDQNSIENIAEILNSLDSLKKEVRFKFKRLTEQEFLVFCELYKLDEEVGYTDYKTLSQRLKLTESSIRDYIQRLIKKGIPVDKNKINNKNIQLSISQNLKKIATLPTILQLREL